MPSPFPGMRPVPGEAGFVARLPQPVHEPPVGGAQPRPSGRLLRASRAAHGGDRGRRGTHAPHPAGRHRAGIATAAAPRWRRRPRCRLRCESRSWTSRRNSPTSGFMTAEADHCRRDPDRAAQPLEQAGRRGPTAVPAKAGGCPPQPCLAGSRSTLLRAGRRLWRTRAGEIDLATLAPRPDYLATVSRAWERGFPYSLELFPTSLREPLPVIGVPLREGEPETPLDLQRAFLETYDDGPYRRGAIDYTRPPNPPLPEEHRDWAGRAGRRLAWVGVECRFVANPSVVANPSAFGAPCPSRN